MFLHPLNYATEDAKTADKHSTSVSESHHVLCNSSIKQTLSKSKWSTISEKYKDTKNLDNHLP